MSTPAALHSEPIAGTGARAGSRRTIFRLKRWLRRLLRLRTGVKVGGVYFKELSPLPLTRALSPKGPGRKDYRVTFRDRSKQIIHVTRRRHYGDLCGPGRLVRYKAIRDRLRPGMRILDAACGTGHTSAWLAAHVGAYGCVVALDHDEESIEFAQRRYRLPNVAFELTETTSLAGETDESFDGAVYLLEEWEDDGQFLSELWRVVKPGGWLLLGPVPRTVTDADVLARLQPSAGGGDSPEAPRPASLGAVVADRQEEGDLLIEKVAEQRS